MNRIGPKIMTLIVTAAVLLLPWSGRGDDVGGQQPKAEYFTGKVMPLADLLKQRGIKLDDDANPYWLVLATFDGKILPLVKDDGSRMFYKDRELLRRPMRLTGRQVPGSDLLQVTAAQSYVDGKWGEVYYWCEKCQLRYTEPGNCFCCGSVVVRVEEPMD
jgi:hypothetical protein